MILTVTLNPLLEQRFIYKQIKSASQNRDGKLIFAAGGKGINVSRQLKNLKVQNVALTFAGGTFGKLFRNSLKNEEIDFSLINTKSDTRTCIVVIDSSKDNVSYFFGENPAVTKEEVENFVFKMEKMIQNCEIVVFSGSSPCKETDVIFPAGIEMANKYDKVSICDTYGSHLNNCFDASPRIVHNNIEEMVNSFSLKLDSKREIIKFLDSLYHKGIKQVYLTDGDKDFYSSSFDFHYNVTVPKIEGVDSTGSGDAFVAGIAYGWHKNLTYNEQLKLAVSLGAANAEVFDVCNVKLKDAEKFIERVEIVSIGKKIKVINDSPD